MSQSSSPGSRRATPLLLNLVAECPQLLELHLVDLDLGCVDAPGRWLLFQEALGPRPQLRRNLGLLVEDVDLLLGVGTGVEELFPGLAALARSRDEAVVALCDRDRRQGLLPG